MSLPLILLLQTTEPLVPTSTSTSPSPSTSTSTSTPTPTPTPPPTPTPAKEKPLDVAEPTFGEFDFSWMNGGNSQPSSLLGMGPVTWSLYIDTYFALQGYGPKDHTIFPTTTAPRHNEVSLNLAHVGVDVTGLDGPIGRLYIQYGTTVQTIAGQDTTTTRGYFLTNALLQNVQQAAAGWHFHALHGINVEAGIFPSYIGLESYLPEENWAYTHTFTADATPYYFFGGRGQLFLTSRQKLELWVVNGWQTFGQWHEGRAGGYLWNWRPREWLSIVNSSYAGQDVQNDPKSARLFSDNNLQLRYYQNKDASFMRSLAFSLTGDFGYESRSNAPSGGIAGAALTHRWDLAEKWKASVRGDVLYDETQAISPKFPVGSPYPWKGTSPFVGVGGSATVDFWPSPWLLTRLEYSHRWANQPLFSGPGGITSVDGLQSSVGKTTFGPDLRRTDDRVILNVTLRL